jgi:hypothetical protein
MYTANKKQKLENFAQVKMWYLQPQCNVQTLAPLMGKKKTLYDSLASKYPHAAEDGGVRGDTFGELAQQCCRFDGNL